MTTPPKDALTIPNDLSLSQIGETFAKSGYFADAREAAQSIVKVLAGQEIGVAPVQAMTGIHIIKGRIQIGAVTMGSVVKRSGRYDYLVREITDENCAIEYFEFRGQKRVSIGVSTFSIEDARRAGTQNIDKFPRNMLYSRAMSNGVRWFCPDVFGGPTFAPGEIEDDTPETNGVEEIVTASGDVVDGETGEVVEEKPKKDAYFRFLDLCGEVKETIGEERYYEILGEYNIKHANEAPKDREILKQIANALLLAQDDAEATGAAETDEEPSEEAGEGNGGEIDVEAFHKAQEGLEAISKQVGEIVESPMFTAGERAEYIAAAERAESVEDAEAVLDQLETLAERRSIELEGSDS